MQRTDSEEGPTLKADSPSSYSARNVKQSNKSKQECSNCRRVFYRRSLNRHILLCKGKNFPCDKCQARFETEARLDEHRAGHLAQVCSICNKTLANAASLNVHLRNHLGTLPYKCTICDKGYATGYDLKNHQNRHLGIKPHKCTFCEQSFVTPFELRAHMNRHQNIKPHKCGLCKLAFTSTFELNTHMANTHLATVPRKCFLCPETFMTSTKLNTHLVKHLGLQPYKCNSCMSTFRWITSIRNHVEKSHIEVENDIYGCSYCASSFKTANELNEHVRQHPRYKCFSCELSFKTLMKMKTHMRVHGAQFYSGRDGAALKSSYLHISDQRKAHEDDATQDGASADEELASHLSNGNECAEDKMYMKITDTIIKTEYQEVEEFQAIDESAGSQGSSVPSLGHSQSSNTYANPSQHDLQMTHSHNNSSQSIACEALNDDTELEGLFGVQMDSDEHEKPPKLDESFLATPALRKCRKNPKNNINQALVDLQRTDSPSNASQSIACEPLDDDRKQEAFFDVPVDSDELEKQPKLDESFLATPPLRKGLKNPKNKINPVVVDLQRIESLSSSSQSVECEALDDDTKQGEGVFDAQVEFDEYEKLLKQKQSILATTAIRNRIKNRINKLKQAAAQPAPLEDQRSQHSAVKKQRSSKCQICFKTFKNGKSLRMHRIQHTSRFKCDHCNKTFQGVSHLEEHIQSHLGIKTKHCTVCNASFTCSSNLRNHMRSHSGKMHKCDICGRSFYRKTGLEDHRNVHLGTTPYQCDLCPKSYAARKTLANHKNNYH